MRNEVSMIKRAELYMNLLSQQKDPFTGQAVPADSLLNNERLLRCFHFVSQILQEVLAEKSGADSLPVSPPSQRAGEDLPLSKITEKLHAPAETAPSPPLETSELTEWLLLSGYLCHSTREDGTTRIVPAAKGEALGIYRTERTRRDGRIYHLNLYPPNVQELLRAHLPEILEQSSRRVFRKKRDASS